MRRLRASASPGRRSPGRRKSETGVRSTLPDKMTRFITFALTLLLATAAHGYLPPKGVELELVEFSAGGKTLQGGLFVPDSKRFAKPLVVVVLVHGVESYWYEGPPMFLAGLLA